MHCMKCHCLNVEGARFCSSCGFELPVICPTCSANNSPNANFCNQCATPIAQKKNNSLTYQINPRSSEQGEHRQLTVMFCDLVESTRLSCQFDPEDWRDILKAYQATCAEVIQHYDGYIAQFLGDGLLVYHGYPVAHEDSAQRAVYSGLQMIKAMHTLNVQLKETKNISLKLRIGIHTGPVVLSHIGASYRQEPLALGETPNIAARLQSLAKPDGIVLSEQTRQLLKGLFHYEELGCQLLKGSDKQFCVFQVIGEKIVNTRFEAASSHGLTPFIGRFNEMQLLLRQWEDSKRFNGRTVVLSGEAGIGKSRLMQMLRAQLADEEYTLLQYQCSGYHKNSAFYPIITQFERAAGFAREDDDQQKFNKLNDLIQRTTPELIDSADFLADLLALSTTSASPNPWQPKDKVLQALTQQLLALAQMKPILLCFEDAHWSDPSTLDMITAAIHSITHQNILMVITYRLGCNFISPWKNCPNVIHYQLDKLNYRQCTALASGIVGSSSLPSAVLDHIIERSDGVPLFIEELTNTLLQANLVHDTSNNSALAAITPNLDIPSTLQDALMARLDEFPTTREVAQVGAVIGREFSYDLLFDVLKWPKPSLDNALQQLLVSGLIQKNSNSSDSLYYFKHALLQDAAYNSLLKDQRQKIHHAITEILSHKFPEFEFTQPELLARHAMHAGKYQQALYYWKKAGQLSLTKSAYVEAIAHIQKGLQLIKELDSNATTIQDELDLRVALGMAYIVTKGYSSPDVATAYHRAKELCHQVEHSEKLFAVVQGLWLFHLLRADIKISWELAEYLLSLSEKESEQSAEATMLAHRSLGLTVTFAGQFTKGTYHLKHSYKHYDQQQHNTYIMRYGGSDPGVSTLATLAYSLWPMGFADQALNTAQLSLNIAKKLNHDYSQGYALTGLGWALIWRGDIDEALRVSDQAIALSQENGFPSWLAHHLIFQGWCIAHKHHAEEGIKQILCGLHDWRETGAELAHPWFLTLLADAYLLNLDIDSGLTAVNQAIHVMENTQQNLYLAEAYRLKGELLLKQSHRDLSKGLACLEKAISIAQQQNALSWQLRAALSLAQHHTDQGLRHLALHGLQTCYDQFSEGQHTADLVRAKHLLADCHH